MSEDNKKEKPEKPEEIIDQIVESCNYFQKKFGEGAVLFGEASEQFQTLRPAWKMLSGLNIPDPHIRRLIPSGVDYLASIRNGLNSYRSYFDPHFQTVQKVLPPMDTTASITEVTMNLTGQLNYNVPDHITLPRTDKHYATLERLKFLDQALLRTYEEIREVLYGTRADPERAALYLMRQSFDHLFTILAPDIEVRESPYWSKKSGEEPDLVTREERLAYAADRHISDEMVRDRICRFTAHAINVYQTLNSAHKRGSLSPEHARRSLREMQFLIEEWIEALDLDQVGDH